MTLSAVMVHTMTAITTNASFLIFGMIFCIFIILMKKYLVFFN